jgi:adenosylcobinamide-GDP ribazoletransferase
MRLLRQEARALWSALLYFTRLPLPAPSVYDPEDLRRAAAYWPLTGVLVALVVGGLCLGFRQLLPVGLACALSLGAGVLLTGAMHEDGLADVCDGLGGGATRERALEIMKDSAIGAFGGIGLVLSLLIRWQCLVALPCGLLLPVLSAAALTSRSAAVTLMSTQDYVRTGPSKARPLVDRLHGWRLTLVLLLGLLPLAWLPLRLWPCLLAVGLVRLLMGIWFLLRLGGYTGDCLGALQQVAEMVALLTAISLS